jgi:hypothetical protein
LTASAVFSYAAVLLQRSGCGRFSSLWEFISIAENLVAGRRGRGVVPLIQPTSKKEEEL